MKKFLGLIIIFVAVVFSCSHKMNSIKSMSVPLVTYTSDIKPLIDKSCTPCHVPSKGGFKANFDNYDSSKKYIDAMIVRVQLSATDPKFMPFKSKKPALTADEIALLKNWKNGGLKN